MSEKNRPLLQAWIVFCDFWPGDSGTREGKQLKTRAFWKAWNEFKTLPHEVDYRLWFQKAAGIEAIRQQTQGQRKPLF